jgi:DNA repair exonuclease SbcCD ATPase subunit
MNEEITQNMPDGRSFEERVMARFDALDASMREMRTSMQDLNTRLTALEERVDQRLKETRPIWEQVLVRLDGMDARFDKFDARLARVEKNLDYLRRKSRIYDEDILTWQNQQEDMEERVSKLESEQAK